MDRWILTVLVQTELSWKAKLSIYQIDIRSNPHLWLVSERTRLWIREAEMNFLRRVSGLGHRDWRSSG